MANNYHWEALRKQRVLERKADSLNRLDGLGIKVTDPSFSKYTVPKGSNDTTVITDAGQFEQQRSRFSSKTYDGVVFDEVIHDPNFKFRIQKFSKNPPVHVDPIYRIIYPSSY